MANSVEVVKAASTDAALGLLRAQFREHDIGVSDDTLAAAVRELVATPSRGALLLAHAPAPVGIAALAFTWTLEHGGLVAWLDELYVIPEMRDHGIGRDLLHHAIQHAKDAGCLAMELEIEAGHDRAARLYEREGFAPLARARWALSLTS